MLNPRHIGAALGSLGPQLPLVREMARNRPTLKSTSRRLNQLEAAFDQRVDELKPGAEVGFLLATNTPQDERFIDRVATVVDHPNRYASSSAPGKPPGISINLNADRALYAHELGHLASQQTDVGHFVASLRANPKLKAALLGSMITAPGIAAALQPGDGDLDESLALAAISTAPTLVDEVLATKNGLAIMDTAGLRASLGQRGKLAGGLLSYLAAPLIAGTAANVVGNQFDSDPVQTSSTLMP